MSKYLEKNFVEFIHEDNDIIKDSFIDYLMNNATIKKYGINEVEQYRIDLIADNIYGNKDLYWILLRINAILHIEELAERHIIKYVEIQDIESAYLKWRESK